jgi:uncharacterized protein (UPF0218 family)
LRAERKAAFLVAYGKADAGVVWLKVARSGGDCAVEVHAKLAGMEW